MKIKTAELLSAIARCMPGVETGKTILQGTDTLAFSEGNVHSYNDTITVSAPFTPINAEDILTGSVKAVTFYKLISKIKDPEFELVVTEDAGWKITFGNTEVEIPVITSSINNHVSSLNLATVEFKEFPDDFYEGVKLCQMNNNQTPLAGIYVSGDTIASTDAARMNKFLMGGEMDEFFINDRVVAELLKLPALHEYAVSESWLHVSLDDGTIFSAKLKDSSNFPMVELNKQFTAHNYDEADIGNKLPTELSEVIDRASVFAADIKGSLAVKLEIQQNHLIVSTHCDAGKIKEKIKWETAFATDPGVEIWVSSSFLIEACQK